MSYTYYVYTTIKSTSKAVKRTGMLSKDRSNNPFLLRGHTSRLPPCEQRITIKTSDMRPF